MEDDSHTFPKPVRGKKISKKSYFVRHYWLCIVFGDIYIYYLLNKDLEKTDQSEIQFSNIIVHLSTKPVRGKYGRY